MLLKHHFEKRSHAMFERIHNLNAAMNLTRHGYLASMPRS
jgi:hypothetical protein